MIIDTVFSLQTSISPDTGLMSSLTGTQDVEMFVSINRDRAKCSKRSSSWSSSISDPMSSLSIQCGWQVCSNIKIIQATDASLIMHISSFKCKQSAQRKNTGISRGEKSQGASGQSQLGCPTGHSPGKRRRSGLSRPLPDGLPSLEKNSCGRGVLWKESNVPKNNKHRTIRTIPDVRRAHVWPYLDVSNTIYV